MRLLLILTALVHGALQARASTEESTFGADTMLAAPELTTPRLSPAESFRRQQLVWDHFGVPKEVDPTAALANFQGRQTLGGFREILSVVDIDAQFARFFRADDQLVNVFQDRDGYSQADFSLTLSERQMPARDAFVAHLAQARASAPVRALRGLRIALDPGHMGAHHWDDLSGKYVHDDAGHWLSEGLLNLQTSLLLERELRALGAEVFVTHRSLAPVADGAMEKLSLVDWGRRALRKRSLENWFQQLLATPGSDDDMLMAFDASSRVKRLFAEDSRADDFNLGADLDARSEKIQAFAPDISLIIHYDAGDIPGHPEGVNPRPYSRTKTYVYGDVEVGEWTSREDRLHAARHLLDPEAWRESLRLARSVAHRLHDGLGIDYESPGGGGGHSKLLEPGVFARNLAVSRKIYAHASSYVECLHYNDPGEFAALLREDGGSITIDGQDYPYSARLKRVVDSLRAAVVDYVRPDDAL